jgi:HEAT repeat protein
LASEDARRAFRAFRALAAWPQETVPFLYERLRLVAAEPLDSPERIARLVAELDDDAFAVRERATRDLEELGKRAEPALRKALQTSTSSETKKRAQALLQNIDKPRLVPERLRAERALELLERIGTDEARQALEQLGQGARNRWLRAAAADSLRRLGR